MCPGGGGSWGSGDVMGWNGMGMGWEHCSVHTYQYIERFFVMAARVSGSLAYSAARTHGCCVACRQGDRICRAR